MLIRSFSKCPTGFSYVVRNKHSPIGTNFRSNCDGFKIKGGILVQTQSKTILGQ